MTFSNSFPGARDPCHEPLCEHSRIDRPKSPGMRFTSSGLRLQPKGQLRGLCQSDVWSCCSRRRKVGSSAGQDPLHHLLPLWPGRLLQVLSEEKESCRCGDRQAGGGTGSRKTGLSWYILKMGCCDCKIMKYLHIQKKVCFKIL